MPQALLIPLGAAVIGGGASIIAGNKAAKAQKDASNQAAGLQQDQNAEARRQYDQNRADLAPWRAAGTGALGQLTAGTQAGGEFNRSFTMADFQADPGAEFRRSEGQRGLEASASARGGILSGGALKAISRYNSDQASQEYGAAYSRYNNDTTTRYNRLAGLAGIGQQATGQGIDAGTNLTGQLQAGVNNITGNINAAGNARASQYANTGGVIAGLANNIGQAFPRRQPNSLASLVPDVNSTIARYPGVF